MVKGLKLFRERFREFAGSMTLIGGAACDQWFDSKGIAFRSTKDLDLVIMTDEVNESFVSTVLAFIEEGGYEIRERSDGSPILYRFANPSNNEFPAKLELCSRKPEGLKLGLDQKYIPIAAGIGTHCLSAILLDEEYFHLIQAHHDDRDGLWVANVTALIPLKAHAWLNLTRAKAEGEPVDSRDINKHRTDVFRLATTLSEEMGPHLPQSIKRELSSFLENFPPESSDWPSILASVGSTIPGTFQPEELIEVIRSYFRLNDKSL
jgi:hypothetical protein